MIHLKYIFLALMLFSCGAKKKSSQEKTEYINSVESSSIENSRTDSLKYQYWNWNKVSAFEIESIDQDKNAEFEINPETQKITFRNARLKLNKKESKDSTVLNNSTKKHKKLKKAKGIQSISEQTKKSKDKEQWKLDIWAIMPFFIVGGLVYLVINHRQILLNWLKMILKKII